MPVCILLLPSCLIVIVAFTFSPGTAVGAGSTPQVKGNISYAAVQSDGKIIAAGGFTLADGSAFTGIIRLNLDGTQDTSFKAFAVGMGTNSALASTHLQLQPNGKVLVYGADSQIFPAVQKDVIRLDANGGLDAGFVAASGLDYQGVGIVTAQGNGKLLLDTGFDRYGGAATGSYHLIRLLKNGHKDTSFRSVYVSNPALSYPLGARWSAVTALPDGDILVAGVSRK